jgi:hypothetical protein
MAVIRKTGEPWPNWIPAELLAWLEKAGPGLPRFFDSSLIMDPRMRSVWEWHKSCKLHDQHLRKENRELDSSPISLCLMIEKATRMPDKPGNLPRMERSTYLAKVRSHAQTLIDLLKDTQFDVNEVGTEVDIRDMPKKISADLSTWGEDEMGHVVAYWVNQDGVYKLPWDYPGCNMTRNLSDLVEWTYSDDYFGRDPTISSEPVGQGRTSGARVIFFNCTLYDTLRSSGTKVPFSILNS